MQISSVEIHNFRSIKHLKFDLQDYHVLIGPNNAGKSNIIRAILFFYDEIKIAVSDFHCSPDIQSDELYVEVEFSHLLDDEYQSLPDQYKLPNNRLRVRRTTNKNSSKSAFIGYILNEGHEELSDTNFFGAKGVGKGKLGDVVYIPALKAVTDELKTTGAATLAKLLREILEPSIVESDEYLAFSKSVKNLSNKLRGQVPEDKSDFNYNSTSEIEDFINKEMTDWGCEVRMELEPMDPAKLAQQAATVTIKESDHMWLPVESKGQGLQRSLEVALVKLWANVARLRAKQKAATSDRKSFHPEFTLLLIEEPETFQHPQQQLKFYKDLREIATSLNQQVIATTHSPYFITPHTEDLATIAKVVKNNNATQIYFLTRAFIKELHTNEVDRNFRYHMWLNPDRNALFFEECVILVEGITEKTLINWLLKHGVDVNPIARRKIYVMDCGGKFNMDLFMNLLRELGIYHAALFDKDNENKQFHKDCNSRITGCKNQFTLDIDIMEKDLEDYLGIEKPDRANNKPLVLLDYLNDDNARNDTLLKRFTMLINRCVR